MGLVGFISQCLADGSWGRRDMSCHLLATCILLAPTSLVPHGGYWYVWYLIQSPCPTGVLVGEGGVGV